MVGEEPLCGFSISKSLSISFNFFVFFSIAHNTLCLALPHPPTPPPPPPHLKFCIHNCYFQFPLGIMVIPRRIEVTCAKFWWLMSYIMDKGKWWILNLSNLNFFHTLFFQVLNSLVAPPLETLQTVMLTDVVPLGQEWNLKEARVQTLILNL